MPTVQPEQYCNINDALGTGYISSFLESLNNIRQASNSIPITNRQVFRWNTCRSPRSQPGRFMWGWQERHSCRRLLRLKCPLVQASQCLVPLWQVSEDNGLCYGVKGQGRASEGDYRSAHWAFLWGNSTLLCWGPSQLARNANSRWWRWLGVSTVSF